MKKFGNFSSFPMVYHLLHSDKWLNNFVQNTFQSACDDFCFFKIHNKKKCEESYNTKKLRIFCSFPTVYHLCNSDQRFRIYELITTQVRKSSTVFTNKQYGSVIQKQYEIFIPGSTDYCRILFYHRLQNRRHVYIYSEQERRMLILSSGQAARRSTPPSTCQ